VLIKKLIDGQSYDQIEQNGPPLRKTVTRWVNKVLAKLNTLREDVAKYLIRHKPAYFSVDTIKVSTAERFEDLLDKAKMLTSEENIYQYGALSYAIYVSQDNAIQIPHA
jgi:hypothetical protein